MQLFLLAAILNMIHILHISMQIPFYLKILIEL